MRRHEAAACQLLVPSLFGLESYAEGTGANTVKCTFGKNALRGQHMGSLTSIYGGVCYTDIPVGEELTAVVYDSTGSAHQEVWSPSTTGAQGWAHPIDGWAASSATAGCAVKRGAESSSGSSEATSHGTVASQRPLSSVVALTKKKVKKVSGGMIAAAVLGALVALIAILGLVLFLLRRRKRAKKEVGGGEQMSQSDGGSQVEGTQIHQKDSDDARVEVNAVPATSELDISLDGHVYEMAMEQRVSELPAGPDARVNGR